MASGQIKEFSSAVLDHWCFLSGGVFMTLVTLIHVFKDKPIKRWVYLTLSLVFFFFAFFFAWQDQFQLRQGAENDRDFYKNLSEYNQKRIDKLSEANHQNQASLISLQAEFNKLLGRIQSGAGQARPDYIEGTRVTRAELNEAFPFGYVIFFGSQNGMTNWPNPGTRLAWKSDWSEVVFEPDFIERTVTCIIPGLSASITENGQTRWLVRDTHVSEKFNMVLGKSYRSRAIGIPRGEPQMFLRTLNDNQRTPIFVLGFRIDDSKPANP